MHCYYCIFSKRRRPAPDPETARAEASVTTVVARVTPRSIGRRTPNQDPSSNKNHPRRGRLAGAWQRSRSGAAAGGGAGRQFEAGHAGVKIEDAAAVIPSALAPGCTLLIGAVQVTSQRPHMAWSASLPIPAAVRKARRAVRADAPRAAWQTPAKAVESGL